MSQENLFPPKVILGSKIKLVARSLEDAEAQYKIIDSCRDYLNQWMPWVQFSNSTEDTKNYFSDAIKKWDERILFDYTMFAAVSGEMLGGFGLHSLNWKTKSCEFGYWLGEKFQGHGYVTEAVLLGEEVCRNLGLHRVVISCDRRNIKSQNIPKKLGYHLESRQLDQITDHHGSIRDTYKFVKLINSELNKESDLGLPTGYQFLDISQNDFWKKVENKMKNIFSNDLIFEARKHLSDIEKENLNRLGKNLTEVDCHYSILTFNNDVVGWTWGRQDSFESYYMVNSGILPDHRGRGLYSKMLDITLKKLSKKGYQKIWSRHNMTNNEIIIPKLKAGFFISGTELSDAFGTLVCLTYYTNPLRRKMLDFRSGHRRPDGEISAALSL